MIAFTHIPSPHLQAGERTHVPTSEIDHALASQQHAAYCQALVACGVQVVTLDVNPEKPDATFIEDVAVVLDEVAVIASPGAASRRSEIEPVARVLLEHRHLERIQLPATLEGGDVLRIGRRLLVGHSSRTNTAGMAALAAIASRFGYSVESIAIRGCLHLKTACTALPDGRLLMNPAWLGSSFPDWHVISIHEQEPWAANVLLIGEHVVAGAAHPRTANKIGDLGFPVHSVDISEFAKAEGGVTCLSLLVEEILNRR